MRTLFSVMGASCAIVFLSGCLTDTDEPVDTVQGHPSALGPHAPCAGPLGLDCDKGYECVDVADDGCDPTAGGADCPGVCLGSEGSPCGTRAGFSCAPQLECVENVDDDCSEKQGDKDCPGICAPPSKPGLSPTGGPCGGDTGLTCIGEDTCVAPEYECVQECAGICKAPPGSFPACLSDAHCPPSFLCDAATNRCVPHGVDGPYDD